MDRNSSNAGRAALPPGGRGTGLGLSGLIGRIIAALVTGALLVVGLMFSLVLFVVALVGGAAVFGWMWWKMRRVMRQAQQDPRFNFNFPGAGGPDGEVPPRGEVIEGEVVQSEWKDGPGPRG